MKKLTPSQKKALEIVRDRGPIRPGRFADLMWPDSEGHRHHTKCGPSGSCIGGGMNLAGGGYLGRLCRRGWVVRRYPFGRDEGYELTDAGIRILMEENDERDEAG